VKIGREQGSVEKEEKKAQGLRDKIIIRGERIKGIC
jgi:hypothetical protein